LDMLSVLSLARRFAAAFGLGVSLFRRPCDMVKHDQKAV
jgi:hypothetical protein